MYIVSACCTHLGRGGERLYHLPSQSNGGHATGACTACTGQAQALRFIRMSQGLREGVGKHGVNSEKSPLLDHGRLDVCAFAMGTISEALVV